VFDDIAELDAKCIQTIIAEGEISIKDWAFALKGYKEDVQSEIFAKLADVNETLAERIYDEMVDIGLIYASEAVKAQNYIAGVIDRLQKTGGVFVPVNEDA